MSNTLKWKIRYLKLAQHVASWSKDPSTQCGAVIVNADNEIVSIGFNGFPRGVEDSQVRLNDRDLKLSMTLHAERNAILFARQSLKGCTIYTWPMHACSECAAMIIQSGITSHVTVVTHNQRWEHSFEIARSMFDEANISVHALSPNWLENDNESK